MTTHHTKVLIIGGGPAGYTAAIYAARANLKPIQVLGMQPGGQLMITTDVENYPGFETAIQGPWLMDQMNKQAGHVGTTVRYDTIHTVDFSQKPFICRGESGETYTADTVIIATGAQARWLDLPSERTYRGFGVSACATCDGFFFRGKNVTVIGGGNTAVEEAIYLTNHASHVTLVHRRDQLRAEKIAQERLFQNPKIPVIWNATVEEVLGTEAPLSVTGLKLKDTQTGAIFHHETEGVFVAIGHTPLSQIFKPQIETDAEGYILVKPNSTATNIPGVFAAGMSKTKYSAKPLQPRVKDVWQPLKRTNIWPIPVDITVCDLSDLFGNQEFWFPKRSIIEIKVTPNTIIANHQSPQGQVRRSRLLRSSR